MARHDEEPEVPSRTSHTVGTPAHVVAAALDLDARDVADRYGFAPPTLLGILTGIERSLAEIGAADATTAKSIFVEADDALGPRRDLDLFRWFRQEDVEAWDRYVNASARLVLGLFSPLGMPICSRESLIVRTEAAVRDLESDRERLIKEGLGLDRRQPDFHDRLLMHVYPIRPYWLTTYPVDDLRLLTADQVHPTRQSFLDALEPSASAQGAAMPPARSPEAADQGEAGVDVGSVKFAWLSPSDAARLADVRANLLDLKIDILHHLVRTLRTGDATAVWSGCLKLLTEALTASDVQFLLRMDHRLSQAGVLAEERSNAAAVPGRGCWVPLGRLVDLLLFAGYCEEELTVGMMHALSRRWPRPVLYDPLIFKANEQALQAVPYAAFDELVRLEAQQFDFWKRWADRLHAALRKEFKAAVTLEFSIKQAFVPQFGDLVRRYGRWLQDHLEATGIPPDLQFAPAVGQLTAPANVFRRRGQMWTLVYNGTTVYMRDAKGLRYIAMLLARPNREIWSLEMVTAAEAGSPAHPRAQPYRSGTAEQLEAKGLSVADSYWRDSHLDAEAIAAYRRQYEELEEDLRAAQDNNDPERAAQCRTDMAALAEALTKDTGLGGKPRPHGPAELARKSVHAAIARGLDRSEKEHPQLGRHLRSSIETGLVCTYEPETPVTWDL